MKANNSPRIEILQIVRLFAASMIILFHSGQIGNRGFFGVHIFFIISGFLAYCTTRTPVSPGRYLLKRWIRLLPLYWIFTGITFLVLTVRPDISRTADGSLTLFLYSMAFIPGDSLPTLQVGWTLFYEVAFSVIVALSILISHRYRVLIASIILLSLTAIGQFANPTGNFFTFYTEPWYFDFFLGMITGVIYIRLRGSVSGEAPVLSVLSRPLRRIACLVLSAAALLSAFFLVSGYTFSFETDNVFILGMLSFVLILSLLLLMDRFRFPGILITLSGMTYSVYLVEYFTTSVYKRLFPESMALIPLILSLAALFAVTFLVSWIPWKLIEVKLTGFLRQKLLPQREG